MGGQGGRGELIHHVGTEGGTALLPGPGGWVVGGVGEALDGGASSFASNILHSVSQ